MGGGCPYSGRFCLITLVGLGESRSNLFNDDDHQNTARLVLNQIFGCPSLKFKN